MAKVATTKHCGCVSKARYTVPNPLFQNTSLILWKEIKQDMQGRFNVSSKDTSTLITIYAIELHCCSNIHLQKSKSIESVLLIWSFGGLLLKKIK